MDFYDTRKLNRLFTLLNVAMIALVATILFQEFRPTWKPYQEAFITLARKSAKMQYDQTLKEIEQSDEFKSLQCAFSPAPDGKVRINSKRLAQIEQQLKQDPLYQKLLKDLDEAKAKQKEEETRFSDARLDYLKAEDEYFHARSEGGRRRWKEQLDYWGKVIKDLEPKVNAAIRRTEQIQKQIDEMEAQKKKVEEQLAKLQSRLTIVESKVKEYLKKKPNIQDGQIVITELGIVDRCKVCHIAIENPDAKEFPKLKEWKSLPEKIRKALVFHPRFEELIGTHPIDKFGCTPCHRGQGHVLREDQAHAYTEHHWEKPMLPVEFREASCGICHRRETILAGAPTLTKGKQLLEMLGCFGCHDMKGYENIPKIGPQLNHIAYKVPADWLETWISNPKAWSEHTRMPNFFPDEKMSQKPVPPQVRKEQVRAIVAYLVAKSQPLDEPLKKYPGGNPQAGRRLVQDVGCLGCHEIKGMGGPIEANQRLLKEAEEALKEAQAALKEAAPEDQETAEQDVQRARARVESIRSKTLLSRAFGPELSKVGSKIRNADWIFNWVQNPKRLMSTARMPSLRLSEKEAADITAFLLTLREPGITFASYKRPQDFKDEKLIEMGRMLLGVGGQLGDKTIPGYACYSCHDIPGIDPPPPGQPRLGKIGKDLNDEGRTVIIIGKHALDWGERVDELATHQPSEKTINIKLRNGKPDIEKKNANLQTWLFTKLSDPRGFRDGLRMPDFSLSEDEIKALTTVMLSFTTEEIHESYLPQSKKLVATRDMLSDEALDAIEAGRRIIRQRNCVGCHLLEIPDPVLSDGERTYEQAFMETFQHNRDQVEMRKLLVDQLGDEGMLLSPPPLVGQGRRVNHDWLFSFLKDPTLGTGQQHSIRPWLQVRMPTFQFTDEELNTLVRYFAASAYFHLAQPQWDAIKDSLAMTCISSKTTQEAQRLFIYTGVLKEFKSPFKPKPQMVAAGKKLFDLLQCIACHPRTIQEFEQMEDKLSAAPNFALARRRLNPHWILEWVKDPQLFMPGTAMPNNFGDLAEGYKSIEERGAADPAQVPPLVRGSYQKQIEALRDYILTLGPP